MVGCMSGMKAAERCSGAWRSQLGQTPRLYQTAPYNLPTSQGPLHARILEAGSSHFAAASKNATQLLTIAHKLCVHRRRSPPWHKWPYPRLTVSCCAVGTARQSTGRCGGNAARPFLCCAAAGCEAWGVAWVGGHARTAHCTEVGQQHVAARM